MDCGSRCATTKRGMTTLCPTTPRRESKKAYEASVVTPNTTPKRKVRPTPKSSTTEVTPSKKFKVDEEDPVEDEKDFGKAEVAADLFPDVMESPSKRRTENRISAEVDYVYKVINKKTGALGGNGYTGAIYGELTIGSMEKVAQLLVDQCEMGVNSRFIDVGSGLGKPNFHVLHSPGVRLSIGVELEQIRWQLAMHNLNYYLQSLNDPSSGASDLALNREINFIESDIDLAATLDPFTHIYMYDLGFPPPLQQSIANKFNTSVHARYFISYRPPRRVIDEYGYDVEFITQMNTSMFGSGENHTAYFYKRTEASINATNARLLAMTGGVEAGKPKGTRRKVLTEETSEDQDKYGLKVTLPATTRFGKEVPAEEVHCDRIFLHAVQLVAHKEPRVLNDYVYDIVQDHMNSPRGKRERRPSTKLTF